MESQEKDGKKSKANSFGYALVGAIVFFFITYLIKAQNPITGEYYTLDQIFNSSPSEGSLYEMAISIGTKSIRKSILIWSSVGGGLGYILAVLKKNNIKL